MPSSTLDLLSCVFLSSLFSIFLIINNNSSFPYKANMFNGIFTLPYLKSLHLLMLRSLLPSGLLSSVVLSQLDGRLGHAGWSWLYIIEGAITIGWCFAAVFMLPDYPSTTKSASLAFPLLPFSSSSLCCTDLDLRPSIFFSRLLFADGSLLKTERTPAGGSPGTSTQTTTAQPSACGNRSRWH
jgi:hypothetical protein